MTINLQDATLTFTAPLPDGKYYSDEPDGKFSYSIDTVGAGTAPQIFIWDRFRGQSDGATIDVDADIGTWREAGSYLNPRPPVISYKGRKGVPHYSTEDGQGATRYGLAVENIEYTSSIEFFKMACPSDLGRTFPGEATALETFPGDSSLKWTWHNGHGWNGSAGECDRFSVNHSGNATFRSDGNNMAGNAIHGFASAFAWSEWNSVLQIYQPEIGNITGPNGKEETHMWNSKGNFTEIYDPFACWQQKIGTTPSMQTPLKFDRIGVMAWSGNGIHTNSQMYLTQYILYGGDDRGAYILLANSDDVAAATNADGIGYDSWIDTNVAFTITAEEKAANTHYFIYSNFQLVATGEL